MKRPAFPAMKTRPILIALLALSLLANAGFALQSTPKPVQWDYEVVLAEDSSPAALNPLRERLDHMGKEGWELVSTDRFQNAGGTFLRFYMKRQK